MSKNWVILLFLAVLLSGCIVRESQEQKIQLTSSGAEVWEKGVGYRSDETDSSKIKADFDQLVQKYENYETEMGEHGVYTIDKKIYLKDGKIVTESHALVPSYSLGHLLGLIESNGERMMVLEFRPDVTIQTNGRQYKTDRNAVLVWPSDAKVLTWTWEDAALAKQPNNFLDSFKAWQKK